MPSRWHVDCLKQRISSLRAEIQRVQHKHHPYDDVTVVFTALVAVLDAREAQLKEAQDLFAASEVGDIAAEALAQQFLDANRDIDDVVDLFTSCDRVDSARIPFEMVRSLRIAAEELIGEECAVVLHLSPDYNYEVRSVRWEFEQNGWLEQWPGDRTDGDKLIPRTVLIIVFPSYEVSSIPLHAVAAHELAHLLADKWGAELKAITKPLREQCKLDFREQREQWISDRLMKVPSLSSKDVYDRVARVLKRRERIAHEWVNELLIDMIAVRLVGPAFFAALERMTLGLGGDTDEHPPDNLRREVVRHYVRDHLPLAVRDPADAAAWMKVLDHVESSGSSDVIHKMANKVCQDALPALAVMVSRVPSLFTDKADVWSGDRLRIPVKHDIAAMPVTRLIDVLAYMQEDLFALIPGSDVLNPKSRADVAAFFWLLFYAAWRFRLDERRYPEFLREYRWTSAPEKGEHALGSLLLHSIQSLELKQRWMDATVQELE